jgi:hypothetical protein
MSRIEFDNKYYYSKNELKSFIEEKIEKKSDINFQDDEGQTLLMISSLYPDDSNFLEITRKLLKDGANLDLQDKRGWTALMMASCYSNTDSSLETIQELINAGANLDLQTIDGWTALMWASLYSNMNSSLQTVRELIKAGANLDLQNINGWTALMVASRYSNTSSSLETVQELIKAGANLNLQNIHGDTCLSYLARDSNSLELIKEVVSKNVSINHLTKVKDIGLPQNKYNGNSLLHWCAVGIKEGTSSYEILKYLETLNIDKTIKNEEGKAYLDYLDKPDYYLSFECQICYQKPEIITILNCNCHSAKQCIECTRKLDKCGFCHQSFDGYKVIRII